jgi:hypothetical protein
MFEHERLTVTQQLPQLLEPLLRILVYAHELTPTEHELLDRGELPILVKGEMYVWSLGEVELGVRILPMQVRFSAGLNFDKVRLRYLGRSCSDNLHTQRARGCLILCDLPTDGGIAGGGYQGTGVIRKAGIDFKTDNHFQPIKILATLNINKLEKLTEHTYIGDDTVVAGPIPWNGVG